MPLQLRTSRGTPRGPSTRELSREHLRPALAKAWVDRPVRPFHDLRHTALMFEAAAGNPQAYVQLKAGHSQGSITERYIHAAQVLFPGAAARGEERNVRAARPGRGTWAPAWAPIAPGTRPRLHEKGSLLRAFPQ